jgi:antitoxin component HigA of HigAB toxin-antitoxin module
MSSAKHTSGSKKKKVNMNHPKPIDAIRELIEDQQLQIADLTQILKKQSEEIRMLKSKWNARESIEKEEQQRKEQEADKSWFWAARSSE